MQFSHSTAPLKKVEFVQFGILSPDEVKSMSVVKIECPETYENGIPKVGGLLDPRLGTNDRNFRCATCAENMTDCTGHFGHIELCKPMFHIGFLAKVKKVLECVCFYCSKLKNDPKLLALKNIKDSRSRLNAVWEICKSRTVCQLDVVESLTDVSTVQGLSNSYGGCGHRQPIIRKDGLQLSGLFKPSSKEESVGNEGKIVLTAEKVYNVLRKIDERDANTLGFNLDWSRPDWMILTVLPVPPPPVRPSIMMDSTLRGEDDLTHKLADIIKANSQLKKHELDGSPAHILSDYEQLLQFHIATYIDNSIAGQPQALQKSGRPLKSLSARLKGKEGRLRGNLMGKRVDFSARTVITPDPNLSLDQVGVPRSIAKTLTIPETVTPFNLDRLQNLINTGPNEHPGARYVIRDDGQRIDLRYNRSGEIHLQKGYRVERHINDGDLVIFNRQPSLHKMSMMGHRIKVMPYSTFRLNLSVTTPYNADFDGDEMNLHVPQSNESKAEVQEICMVPKQIISPQQNKPCMGIVQDSLTGVRKFTRRDCFMDKSFVMNILMWISDWDGELPEPAIVRPKALWTGKQIVSLLTPRINLVRFHSTHPDKEVSDISIGDTKVVFDDGHLISGIICKKTVGSVGGGLIHVVFNEYGPEIAMKFFNNLQTVVNYWLLKNGFSIGVADTIGDKSTMETINSTINEAKERVQKIIVSAQNNKLACNPGMSIRETFESEVTKELNKARNTSGTSAEKSLKEQNNVKQMVVSGSKGSYLNISQITACLGQQYVESKRIPFGFQYRTLPHFHKDDHGPESRGFVQNSYFGGLDPQEFFFHAMGGREGLIDTAIKTAETGYIQRRLVKALEDVMVKYDGTVRNGVGQIIQFCYGEDGMDAVGIENQSMNPMRMSHEQFEKTFKIDFDDPQLSLDSASLIPDMYEVVSNSAEVQFALDNEYQLLLSDRSFFRSFVFPDGDQMRPLPVNLKRLISDAKKFFNITTEPTDLHPITVIDGLNSLFEKLTVVCGSDEISKSAQKDSITLFSMFVRCHLSTKRAIQDHHLSTAAFNWIIGEIESRFLSSLVNPGEMVGTVAAQSIGEPATQMTLNTFHYAGVSSTVTTGVPRLKEIINIAKNIRTPSVKVYLEDQYSRNVEKAKEIHIQLEHTTLRNVVAATEIFYDPDPMNTVVDEDHEFVEAYYELPDEDIDVNRLSPWLLRVELDRSKMLDKGLSIMEVASKISQVYEGDLQCICNDDNSAKLIIRCRIVNEEGKRQEDSDAQVEESSFLRRIEHNMLSSVTLRGVENINRVFLVENKKVTIKPDGTYGNTNEWVLETEGCNLLEIMSHPCVDYRRTYSNSIIEILDVLGIEAARAAILRELRVVIESDGSYVNYRHLSLLCDVMTSRGQLMSITRHGINRADTGPLMRCSFEETVEILMEAAATAELDTCKGVAENVMLGQLAPLGTGEFDLILDEELAKQGVSLSMPEGVENVYDMNGSMSPMSGGFSPYMDGSTPNMSFSPYTEASESAFSPFSEGSGSWSPFRDSSISAFGTSSPSYSPTSPSYSPTSPSYSPTSPSYSPTSPSYSPTSPSYSPTSPSYSPTSPSYSPTSPSYSPTSPSYSPTSPSYSPTSPSYSPTSPSYSPTSPSYSPTSPSYSPTSPSYSPTSPSYSPTSPSYSPTSPSYSPISPNFSPASPNFGVTSPSYSPASTEYIDDKKTKTDSSRVKKQ